MLSLVYSVLLRIPAKLNALSEGKLNGIPGRSRTPSERSDAGNSIVKESVRLRQEKPVRSAAKEGLLLAGKGVRGKAAGLAPPQHTEDRSALSAPAQRDLPYPDGYVARDAELELACERSPEFSPCAS